MNILAQVFRQLLYFRQAIQAVIPTFMVENSVVQQTLRFTGIAGEDNERLLAKICFHDVPPCVLPSIYIRPIK
jgi:hypothetical protein